MPKCDICGEEFDTERGLHIHQSQKHEDEAESEEVEQETEEAAEEESGSEEAENVEEEDEIVREIEEETEGGLLGGFSRESLVIGGALIGVALGLALGLFLSQSGDIAGDSYTATEADITQNIESLPGAPLNVTGVEKANGVYEVNATRPMSVGNRTISRQLQLHVSPDGEILFLQGTSFEQLRAQLGRQQQAPSGTPPTQESGNTTQ